MLLRDKAAIPVSQGYILRISSHEQLNKNRFRAHIPVSFIYSAGAPRHSVVTGNADARPTDDLRLLGNNHPEEYY